MKVAVVLVHYRTPELVPLAWRHLEEDAAACGLELEGVVVDHGGGEAWDSLACRVVAVDGNPGYAAGVNRGVTEASADLVVAMNPDVLVAPGCLAALTAELDRGAAAAGPRLFWDTEGRWQLPPNERRDAWSELLGVLAARGGAWRRAARRRWRAHTRGVVSARSSRPCHELSGAILAFRRDAWKRVGAFDEAYRLYFEEVDWLDRLRRSGAEARFVPAATAVHLYARSSLVEPRAEAWFARSSRRYRQRRHGRAFTRLLERLARPPRPEPSPPGSFLDPRDGAAPIVRSLPEGTAWLEATPRSEGFPATVCSALPAAGEPLWTDEVWRRAPEGDWRLRAIDAEGRELATAAFQRS